MEFLVHFPTTVHRSPTFSKDKMIQIGNSILVVVGLLKIACALLFSFEDIYALMIFNTPICFHDVRRVPTVYVMSLPSWLGNVLVLGDRSRRYMSAVVSYDIAQICWYIKGNHMVNSVKLCWKTTTPHQLLNSSIFWYSVPTSNGLRVDLARLVIVNSTTIVQIDMIWSWDDDFLIALAKWHKQWK